jgi:hypothetical protein
MGWMAFLQGYFDDSGSDDLSPVVTIGGVLARAHVWPDFCSAWKSALPEGVEFRAADLEFDGYSGSPLSKLPRNEKAELKRSLLDVIERFHLSGATVSLGTKNFWEAHEPTLGKKVPYPYFICALKCFSVMHRIVQGEFPSSIRMCLDEQENVKGRMEKVFEHMQNMTDFAQHYRLFPPQFKPSREHPELQAADLVAHSANVFFKYLFAKDPGSIQILRQNAHAQHQSLSELARPTTKRLLRHMYLFDYTEGPSLRELIGSVEPYLKKVMPELYEAENLVDL